MTEIREPRIVAAAEREMQKWRTAQQIADRIIRFDTAHGAQQKKIGPYITISRQAGAGAEQIAHAVGERLGWEVVDKNVLDAIAKHFCLERSQLENLDESSGNWLRDTLFLWLDPHIISADKFLACLEKVVWMAARKGNVVFVGRGVRFLLPDEHGLAVRLVASEKYRVERIRREKGLSEAAARRFVHELEQTRRQFVQRFFHKDVDDPQWYDLVINVERWGVEETANLIVTAWRAREEQMKTVAKPAEAVV
ncbi:MAG: cytidylate kinase-like family protein [Thermogutta sp.]|nr:cytidylate kinase-like family protein [Thermogutta sp.]HOP77874.1 cytidylate kinase-like family protein [Thermogutta sp.]HPU05891.1 cytidylate kinase-like family protein [Thermogutta sp.]HQF13505.1 cytidylate kinase-like family protein [Thermogutta sp.]